MTDVFFLNFGFTISPTPLLSHTQKPLPHQFHFSFHLSLTLEPTWHASAASACSVAPSLVGWLCLAVLCGVKCVTGSQRGLHRPFTRQRFSRCALIYFYTHTHTMQNKDSSARSSLPVQAVFTCTHKSRLLGETRLGQEIREQVTTDCSSSGTLKSSLCTAGQMSSGYVFDIF